MNARYLIVDERRAQAQGLRTPPIGKGTCGCPVLPREGETVFINGWPFIVTRINWYPNMDVDKTSVVVELTDKDTFDIREEEKR